MNLDAFIHHLHYDTDRARPPDWETDWRMRRFPISFTAVCRRCPYLRKCR